MFQGSMHGNISLAGYYENNLFFGPQFLIRRHAELTQFLKGALVGHKTQITEESMAEAVGPLPGIIHSRVEYPDVVITDEMIKQSRMDLLSRCGTCRNLHLKEKREGRSHRYTVTVDSNLSYDPGNNLADSTDEGNT